MALPRCGLFAQSPLCETITFQKTYGYISQDEVAQDIVETPDQGFITGGKRTTNSELLLMKIDRKGDIVWVHQIGETGAIRGNIKRVIRLREGNYIALCLAYQPDYQDTWIIKFDENGNIIWDKEITYPTGISTNPQSICETSDGGLAICAYYAPYANVGGSLVLKLSSDGNIIWSKTNLNEIILDGLVEKNGFLYLAGYKHSNLQGVIVKMKTSDGTILQGNNIQVDNMPTRFYNIEEKNDKLYINGFNTTNQSFDGLKQVITILDLNLNVLKVHKFKTDFQEEWEIPGMCLTNDGGFIAAEVDDFNADLLLFKVSYEGVLEWKRKYPRNGDERIFMIKAASDNGIIGVGTSTSNSYPGSWTDIYVFKTDSLGKTAGCPVEEINAEIKSPPFTISSNLYDFQSFTFPIIQIYPLNVPITIPMNVLCENKNITSCNSVLITGDNIACNLLDTFLYEGKRNNGCTSPVQWNVDSSSAIIISKTDTTVKIKFKDFGKVNLIGSVINSCQSIADTLEISISRPGIELNLGPDSFICTGNSIELNAGLGYASYLWQDNSRDSKLLVTQPGLYYVTIKDACGKEFKDSISFTAAPPISFNLGPDRTKCITDTIHLTAPAGFLNYLWSNNYNISSVTSQNVIVNPVVDTAYYVKAEKTPGCFAYDTVKVYIKPSPLIDLGPDTSFCEGHSITLSSGAQFASYSWNNGNNTSQLQIKSSGIYSFIGTTSEGCKSFDTITVKVFANPLVSLDHNPNICFGSVTILDAGNFTSYLWNDGSTSRTLSVNNTGTYAVQVKDANGCKGSDTTVIKNVLPLPEKFLPADTAICSYSPMSLSPLAIYNSYLWSNNSSAPSITISEPGTYWLQVKDANQCTGSDTILINAKDCINGFFVPTAFTPNGDGKNDAFRPLLFGRLVKYSFTIYNRWGQIIFKSSDIIKGWNGTYASTQQDSNVFAWSCTYQIEGQKLKTEKGTVVLIR
jgi:gliding motility-associated-like protein